MATDSIDLRKMVQSFRVSELQMLLGFAGRNKTGRKPDLQLRALSLVDKGVPFSVQMKIHDLYKSVRGAPNSTNLAHTINQVATGHHRMNVPDSNPQNDYYNRLSQNNIPVHPDVKLINLPFYDRLAELLKPTSLTQGPGNRFQEANFTFHLTPQQAQDISMSRVNKLLRPGVKYDYDVQIQLRFCLLETTCEQADSFPPSICVRVNNKLAQLPSPIPSNKANVEARRPSRPVDITSLCRLSPTLPNNIHISWASEHAQNYCVSVFLVKKLSPEDLLQRLRQSGHRHPDHSRALIKEKLSLDPDSEVAMTSLHISLMCPLGKMLIKTPCRASTCSHLQCFDADTYLRMNERKPTWLCPVCDRQTCFSKLIIDGLFQSILLERMEAADFTEVKFTADGNWQPMKVMSESVDLFSPSTSASTSLKRPIEQITDITDSDQESTSSKKQALDVIDLTEDSDDSDATIASPFSPPPPSNDSVIMVDTPPRVVSPSPQPSTATSQSDMTSSGIDRMLMLPDLSDIMPPSSSHPLPAHQQPPSLYTPNDPLGLLNGPPQHHPSLSMKHNYSSYLSLGMRPQHSNGSSNINNLTNFTSSNRYTS